MKSFSPDTAIVRPPSQSGFTYLTSYACVWLGGVMSVAQGASGYAVIPM